MGQGWRRVSEAVLQAAPSFTKSFRATSNGRNTAMFKEATEFARSIKLLEKDVRNLLKSIDTQFKDLRGILVSPVPRIYDETADGVVPIENETRLLGANMDIEAIPRAAEEARKRINQEVLDPLHEWMSVYRVIMERMKTLEEQRLELDSRRRTVDALQGKLERVRSNLGSTRHKGMIELKETEETMARKEDKMARCSQHFSELERTVYNSLFTLIRDTSVLRDYTHSCLTIIQECFTAASAAYNAPNPQQSTTNVGYPMNENKYEAQLAAERATPKGIMGGMWDRLRSKGGSKRGGLPESPLGARDVPTEYDQVPYVPPAYNQGLAGSQRHSPGYGVPQHQASMRPTRDSDLPSAQQHYGGGPNYGAAPPLSKQPSGVYNNPGYAPQQVGYGAQGYAAPGGYGNGSMQQSPHRYTQQQTGGGQQPQMVSAGGGWTEQGY